jgi:hypothetical protein
MQNQTQFRMALALVFLFGCNGTPDSNGAPAECRELGSSWRLITAKAEGVGAECPEFPARVVHYGATPAIGCERDFVGCTELIYCNGLQSELNWESETPGADGTMTMGAPGSECRYNVWRESM